MVQFLMRSKAHLLHDAGFTLGEGDVTTRLILNELDIDLPPLTARLVIIVVVVIRSGAYPRALHAASVGTVAITGRVSEIR